MSMDTKTANERLDNIREDVKRELAIATDIASKSLEKAILKFVQPSKAIPKLPSAPENVMISESSDKRIPKREWT